MLFPQRTCARAQADKFISQRAHCSGRCQAGVGQVLRIPPPNRARSASSVRPANKDRGIWIPRRPGLAPSLTRHRRPIGVRATNWRSSNWPKATLVPADVKKPVPRGNGLLTTRLPSRSLASPQGVDGGADLLIEAQRQGVGLASTTLADSFSPRQCFDPCSAMRASS